MLKSYRSAKILFLVISLSLSLATLVLLFLYSYPYKIVVDEKQVLSDTRFNIYIDADNDGISERITPYTHQLTDLTYITLNSAELKNDIGAYHLRRKISKTAQLFFDDFNGDKINDLIIYTINLDTLFVSILDIKKEYEYVDELPLIIREPLFNKHWDLDRVRGNLYDFDNDGMFELLTYIQTAHSVPMRGFIIYDFEENKITNQFITAQAVTNYYISDLNNDSKPEILYTTIAPGNFDKNLRHNDWETNYMMLDSELNIIYKSDVLSVYPSSSDISILDIEDEPRIFISSAQQIGNAQILVLDRNLEVLQKVVFPSEVNSVGVYTLKERNEEKLLAVLYGNDKRVLRIYDKNLQILNEKEFDGNLVISTKSFFLNDDNGCYFLGTLDDNLFIMNSDLDLIAMDEITALIINDYYYLSIGYLNNTVHFLTRKNNIQTYSHLEQSFINSYLIPISILSFPVFYFLLLFFNSIVHYIKKYSDSLKYLINQENNNVILIDHEGKLKGYNPQIISRLSFDNNETDDSILTKIPKNTVLYRLAYDAVHNRINKTISAPIYRELEITEGVITVTPLKSVLGYSYAYLIRFEDRTKVIQHERNLIWASTAQKIAHDIKTPLSIIQLNLSSLKARIEQELMLKEVKGDYFSDIEMIQDEIKRITKLTKDFLKFSNLEKPNFQAVELKEVIEGTKNNFSSYFGNGISIEVDIGKNAEYILADTNQIEQLLQIFIENAIDALNGNGTIKIKTEFIINYSNLPNELISICISDNGCGMEEEKAARIFEPYFTTKIEGTGLGLAIANKIVSDNKGKIEVESVPGKGTIFKIIFPKFTF